MGEMVIMERADVCTRCNSIPKSHTKRFSQYRSHLPGDGQEHCLRKKGRWLGGGLMLLAMTHSWAAETPLGEIGNTQLQQDTGDAVQFTCKGFVDSGANADEIPLFATCRAMVQTVADGPNDLGISDDELAVSLQHIATEEFAASGQLATEIGSNRINIGINRLIEVRRGARGFSIAGIQPDSNTLLAADAGFMNSFTGKRGGAAGDSDSTLWNRFGVFLTGNYSTGDRDRTNRTNEFDFDTYGATLGADYRFTDNLILGAAVTYNDVDSDFDENNSTVVGGSVDADGWGGFIYGTYYSDRFYIDGLAGYAKSDYDTKREINIQNNNDAVYGGDNIKATAKGDPDSDDYTVSIGGGYYFGQDALSFGPYARFTYLKVEVDDYKEKGADRFGLNLDVDGQDWKSVTSVLGGQIAYASSQNFGVITPQARAAWIHEFEDDDEKLTATYVDDPRNNKLIAFTDNPETNYFEVGVGVSAIFSNGVQAFANYDTLLGVDNLTVHYFSLGGRWDF